ncbi:hypothetical protein BDQ12DRAFT_666267 [Crucibulum laeve]|uniref:Bromo domain-containing protein n=1 Tax=Crucibulum laeve TaxID=68775 RepID=A0A5C3MBR0_9AGAR|nr:hypothetical protein BDQ12DRAFT_666267 [Crucibulum laeve]
MDEPLESFSASHPPQRSPRITLPRPPGSVSSGLTLVLPSLKNLKAAQREKQRSPSFSQTPVQDVPVQEKKIPRPIKLKPLKEVLTKLILQIKKKDDYAFFLRPVDPSQVPGYSDIVKRPMDLGTMTSKVEKGKYRSLEEFASDLRLVTTNAKIFNPPGTIYYTEAERIEAWGLDHIAKAASTVIQYETDWNIDIEKDEEGPSLNIDDEDDDNVATPMDIEGLSARGRSQSVLSQTQPGSSKRGPRGPYRKQGAATTSTFSESLDAEGGLPGSKDGLGAFPPGSDWAATMLALKLKGKRYRTKKERLRFEREGPPYLPDGSLDYTEMEEPFSVLSFFVPDPPQRPQMCAIYPPLAIPQTQSQPPTPHPQPPLQHVPFPASVAIPSTHQEFIPPSIPATAGTKRRHWTVTKNVPSRKGKEREDEMEGAEISAWQVPRDAHAVDYGSFALLAGELAEEMRKRGYAPGSVPDGKEEELVFDAIRESLDCVKELGEDENSSGVGVGVGAANGSNGTGGYWTDRRAAEAEDYIRDVVYGGVDGMAYVRSLAEFVSNDREEATSPSTSSSGGLGMPLAKWVEQNIVDSLTGGRHSLLREAAIQLRRQSPTTPRKQEEGSTQNLIAKQVSDSLRVYPAAIIALSALLQIKTHKIDMAALIKTPEELFLSEEEWAGKGLKEKRKRQALKSEALPTADEAMEVEEPERTWMDVDVSAGGGVGDGAEYELEGPAELNEVLEYVARLIHELDQRIRSGDNLTSMPHTNGKTGVVAMPNGEGRDGKSSAKGVEEIERVSSSSSESMEDPTVRNLRLNLLALAKRAPLDTIARLPKDLVPEHIRHYVPTLGP